MYPNRSARIYKVQSTIWWVFDVIVVVCFLRTSLLQQIVKLNWWWSSGFCFLFWFRTALNTIWMRRESTFIWTHRLNRVLSAKRPIYSWARCWRAITSAACTYSRDRAVYDFKSMLHTYIDTRRRGCLLTNSRESRMEFEKQQTIAFYFESPSKPFHSIRTTRFEQTSMMVDERTT